MQGVVIVLVIVLVLVLVIGSLPSAWHGSDSLHCGVARMSDEPFLIRRLDRRDRGAVRGICAATAWMGSPDPDRVPDDWLWAEFWTRFFTDRQQQCSWVAEHRPSGRVVGYLTGLADARDFGACIPWLLPGLVLRIIRRRLMRAPGPRRAILGLLRSLAAGELNVPPALLRQHPATFHANLLSDARRCGLGRRMLRRFLDQMRGLGIRGVHAQPLSENRPIQEFLLREGFRLAARRPLRAFAHVDPRPIEVVTFVLAL